MTAYDRWAAGFCPCCGGEICDWEGHPPKVLPGGLWRPLAIAEGLLICGRCHAMAHMPDGDPLTVATLEAIIVRHDGPIDALMPAGEAS